MYFILEICLVFALLFVLNIAASLAATLLWRTTKSFARNWSGVKRARFIFGLRVFPYTIAMICVLGFLLPSYFLFEPESSNETVSFKLVFLSLLSAVGMTIAFYRVFGTWWRTRDLIKKWLSRSKNISIENISLPVFKLAHPFPVIAVIGILRPRIFIAEQIFELLDERELSAAIAHEFGHLASRDNFKRTLLRVCSDLLVFPIGKTLDRVWSETAEAAADEYAASAGDRRTALDLAAALVKIARVIPPQTNPAMPLGSYFIEETDITWRVRHLLNLAENGKIKAARKIDFIFWLGLLTFALSIFYLTTNYFVLLKVHGFLESVVAILQ